MESCRNELRNKAKSMGADLVVIENETIGNGGCGNCVSMIGTTYKVPTVPPSSGTPQ